jgi:16S rRNA (guanine527-N7)-methyltransferase
VENAAKKEPRFQWRLGEWLPDLTPETQSKLKLFNDELLRFNKTISLVSVGTVDKIDQVHFADSILGWRLIRKTFKGKSIFDIGSGNGFPGLVISILEPDLGVVLVESDTRKAEYLKHCIDVLGLKNTKVLIRRIESVDPGSVGSAMVRGFANITRVLLTFRKIMTRKGEIFHFKGPEWITELTAMPQQLCSTWNNDHLGDYSLPGSQVMHTVVRSHLI